MFIVPEYISYQMDITTNYLIQFTLACLVLLSCQVSIGYSAVRCFRISTEENANNRGTSYGIVTYNASNKILVSNTS